MQPVPARPGEAERGALQHRGQEEGKGRGADDADQDPCGSPESLVGEQPEVEEEEVRFCEEDVEGVEVLADYKKLFGHQ